MGVFGKKAFIFLFFMSPLGQKIKCDELHTEMITLLLWVGTHNVYSYTKED